MSTKHGEGVDPHPTEQKQGDAESSAALSEQFRTRLVAAVETTDGVACVYRPAYAVQEMVNAGLEALTRRDGAAQKNASTENESGGKHRGSVLENGSRSDEATAKTRPESDDSNGGGSEAETDRDASQARGGAGAQKKRANESKARVTETPKGLEIELRCGVRYSDGVIETCKRVGESVRAFCDSEGQSLARLRLSVVHIDDA